MASAEAAPAFTRTGKLLSAQCALGYVLCAALPTTAAWQLPLVPGKCATWRCEPRCARRRCCGGQLRAQAALSAKRRRVRLCACAPARRTLPCVWNVVTSSFVELHVLNVRGAAV
jgi:hypothetical protein